ncbi:hypothetical protein K440DRAFT_17962 [Wilcoxina mikolae CBS 423.85]|nr:hypothetical protein K440DRAFT_17962 [Wilcoxina mikolae CBS 423.85]
MEELRLSEPKHPDLQQPRGWTSAEVTQTILALGQLFVAIAALLFGNYPQIRVFLLGGRAQRDDEEAGDARGLVPGVQHIYRRLVNRIVVFWGKCGDVARDLMRRLH